MGQTKSLYLVGEGARMGNTTSMEEPEIVNLESFSFCDVFLGYGNVSSQRVKRFPMPKRPRSPGEPSVESRIAPWPLWRYHGISSQGICLEQTASSHLTETQQKQRRNPQSHHREALSFGTTSCPDRQTLERPLVIALGF